MTSAGMRALAAVGVARQAGDAGRVVGNSTRGDAEHVLAVLEQQVGRCADGADEAARARVA